MLPPGEELLSNELRQLELQRATESQSLLVSNDADIPRGQANSQHDSPQQASVRPPWPHVRDGYGFRPPSGVSTPLTNGAGSGSPLPDPNGLGWPGTVRSLPNSCSSAHISPSAKSTVSRLNATPQELAARQERMASAVRTILECIGEDPDREGLLKTPERYAQALMWMTRGYEERLAGGFTSYLVDCTLHVFQTSSTMPYSRKTMMRWFWSVTSTSQACVNIM